MVANVKGESMGQFKSFVLNYLKAVELVVRDGDPGGYCIFEEWSDV